MTNEKYSKKLLKFSCEICNFKCSNKQDYTRHLSTGKHEILTNPNEKTPKNSKAYMCSCGKSYKHSSSLCGHKKKCNYNKELKNEVVEVIELSNAEVVVEKKEEEMSDRDLIVKLMNENMELHKTIKDIIPKIGNNNNTTNNNNNTNNFNLQVFLNETCKDAINIKDFINSLRVQCNEMKEIQNIGFIEVASKVLLKELSEMDVTKRPIHCSDLKRETLYIKDNDVWGKESESKPNMLHMMQQMQQVSYSTLDDWISKNPGCHKPDHPGHSTFMDTWGDICVLDQVKDVKKVSKRIAKEVLIDKEKNK